MRRENRGPSASACTARGHQHRGGGFPGEAVPAPGHPRTRGRPLLLLFAADHPPQAVPRPCCAASGVGTEFLSKPGVLLSGLQLTEGGAPRRRVCTLAVSRAALERRRADAFAPSMTWPPASSSPCFPASSGTGIPACALFPHESRAHRF